MHTMTLRAVLFSFLIVVASHTGHSQQIEVSSMPAEKLGGARADMVMRFPLLITDEHVVRIQAIPGAMMSSKSMGQVFDRTTGSVLSTKEIEFPEGNNNTRPVYFFDSADGLWVIYSVFYNKGFKYIIRAAKLELPAMAWSDDRDLMTLPGDQGMDRTPFEVRSSGDGSKLAIYYDRFKRKDKGRPAVVAVYDAAMQLLWNKEVSLADDRHALARCVRVDNNGVVYSLRHALGKTPNSFDEASDLLLFKISNEVKTTVVRPFGEKGTVQAVSLAVGNDGSLHVAGFGSPASAKKNSPVSAFVTRYTSSMELASNTTEEMDGLSNVDDVAYVVAADGTSYLANLRSQPAMVLATDDAGMRWKNSYSPGSVVTIRALDQGLGVVIGRPTQGCKTCPHVAGLIDQEGVFVEKQQLDAAWFSLLHDDHPAWALWHKQGLLASEVRYEEPDRISVLLFRD